MTLKKFILAYIPSLRITGQCQYDIGHCGNSVQASFQVSTKF